MPGMPVRPTAVMPTLGRHHVGTAAGTAEQTGQEGLDVAQVDPEDRRLGDAEQAGHGHRHRDGLDLHIAGLEVDREASPTLGHVGHGPDGQQEVDADGRVDQQPRLDGVEAVVDPVMTMSE